MLILRDYFCVVVFLCDLRLGLNATHWNLQKNVVILRLKAEVSQNAQINRDISLRAMHSTQYDKEKAIIAARGLCHRYCERVKRAWQSIFTKRKTRF